MTIKFFNIATLAAAAALTLCGCHEEEEPTPDNNGDDHKGEVVVRGETLRPEDDAARSYWGGKWRTPSPQDFAELQNECKWEWQDKFEGLPIEGYLVTGPNGNSIFLPTTSYISHKAETACFSKTALYWTNTPGKVLYWYSDQENKKAYVTFFDQYKGCAIRPVMD